MKKINILLILMLFPILLFPIRIRKSSFSFNGIDFNIKIYEISGMEYLNIFDIAEIMDIKIGYDNLLEKGILKKDNTLLFHIFDNRIIFNNKIVYLVSSPIIYRTRLLFPASSLDQLVSILFNKRQNYKIYLKPKVIKPLKKDFTKKDIKKRLAMKNQDIQFIMIDPGHGGKDPGAIGYSGKMEKNIVLSVAKRIVNGLKKKYPNIKILLTRKKDIFLKLNQRTDKANSYTAHLGSGIFISIHANASLNKKASGFEIFYLTPDASDDEAREVAAIENGVIELEAEEKDTGDYLQKSLWQMLQNEFLKESYQLSKFIINSVSDNISHVKTRKIRNADFFVLRGVAMPAVLLELGFITNPAEEKRLNSKEYQEQLSKSIILGISKFLDYYKNSIITVNRQTNEKN